MGFTFAAGVGMVLLDPPPQLPGSFLKPQAWSRSALLPSLRSCRCPDPLWLPCSCSPLPRISPCWETPLLDKGASSAWFPAKRAESQHIVGSTVSGPSWRAQSASHCIPSQASLPNSRSCHRWVNLGGWGRGGHLSYRGC